MNIARLIASLLLVLTSQSLAFAQDSFELIKDGRTYSCTAKSAGGCWEQSPYGFDTTVAKCGGGDGCWKASPYGFDTTASKCGGGESCWNASPYGFDTTVAKCGGGEGCWKASPYGFDTTAAKCGTKSN